MSEPTVRPHVICIVSGQARIQDADPWKTCAPTGDAAPTPLAAHGLIDLASLLAQAGELPGFDGPVGVTLAPGDDPEALRPLLDHLSLIAVQFPKFTDGRGYSIAYLLRRRLGWRGQLRAVGDVLQDQLFALRRVGFDSFELRADRDPQKALAGFGVFTNWYQGSADNELPAFRRPGWPS